MYMCVCMCVCVCVHVYFVYMCMCMFLCESCAQRGFNQSVLRKSGCVMWYREEMQSVRQKLNLAV